MHFRCDIDHCQIKKRHLHRELLDGSQAVVVDWDGGVMFFEVHLGVPMVAGVVHSPT